MNHIIGVLAFHGDVREHIDATIHAASRLGEKISVLSVRTREDLLKTNALIIPGGESTTLHKLAVREHMWDLMKKLPYIFGTCAGAILLADEVLHKAEAQESLSRLHVTIDRNAYGRQSESFEEPLETMLGTVQAVYIRAPKIVQIQKNVTALATRGKEVIACEESQNGIYSLATCFHPEMTSTLFHEYFLKKVFS